MGDRHVREIDKSVAPPDPKIGHNARMGSLLVITGPPGAGKSTVSEEVARRLRPSALVEGDSFFHFLRNGAIDPWLPESTDQNVSVTRAAGAAAGEFARGGVQTVFDGVIGSWFLDEFLKATKLGILDYAVLLPPVDICVQRVLARERHGFKNEAATRQMHEQFTVSASADRHFFRQVDQSPDELAAYVLAARDRGDLRYHTL